MLILFVLALLATILGWAALFAHMNRSVRVDVLAPSAIRAKSNDEAW